MQVTMKVNRHGGSAGLLAAGSTYDLAEDLARQLVTAGYAVYQSVPRAADYRPDGSAGGGATLADALRRNAALARNNNPFDLGVMSSPPTVTVGATALTNGQAVNYFDTDGYKRIRIRGIPFAPFAIASVMCENAAGYLRGKNIANSAGALTYGNNAKHYLAEVTFSGQIIQFVVNGLNAALLRFRVDGALISATPTTAGSTIVQLDFGSAVYARTIQLEFEQAQTLKGVIVGPNDTVYAVDTPLLPIPVLGDSYVQGSTGPVTVGGESYIAALRDISGCNILGHGIASSGYVKTGFPTFAQADRIAAHIAVINAASAPLTIVALGTNDYGLSASAIQSECASGLSQILANTTTKIAVLGPWPQARNNDAASLAVEAAISAAVDSVDESRVGFIPVCSGNNPWVRGQGSTGTAPNGTTVAYGNSATVTGSDNVHPAPPRGSEYLARKTLDAVIALCVSKGW